MSIDVPDWVSIGDSDTVQERAEDPQPLEMPMPEVGRMAGLLDVTVTVSGSAPVKARLNPVGAMLEIPTVGAGIFPALTSIVAGAGFLIP